MCHAVVRASVSTSAGSGFVQYVMVSPCLNISVSVALENERHIVNSAKALAFVRVTAGARSVRLATHLDTSGRW